MNLNNIENTKLLTQFEYHITNWMVEHPVLSMLIARSPLLIAGLIMLLMSI